MNAARSSCDILMQEHSAILGVLELQDRAVVAVESGRPVDVLVFEDLAQFFSLFVGACHHGKEEQIVFPVLRRDSALAGHVLRLEAEHVEGGRLVDDLAEAVRKYAVDGASAVPDVARAARAYAQFLRGHILRENDDVLKRAGAVTDDAEEAALVASFDRFEEEVMGKGTHERLHAMIDSLGPRIEALES